MSFIVYAIIAIAFIINFIAIGGKIAGLIGDLFNSGAADHNNHMADIAHQQAMDAHRQATEQAMRDHHTAHNNAMHNFETATFNQNAIHEMNHMTAIENFANTNFIDQSMHMGGFGGMGMM